MKKFLLLFLLLGTLLPLNAQNKADDTQTVKPEFTVRYYGGFLAYGPAVTGGVRLNDKYTLGLMFGHDGSHYDAYPADIYRFTAGAYARRYFRLSQKDIVSFYFDVAVGAAYVYKINGGYRVNYETGERTKEISETVGDVEFAATLQPGIRFRLYHSRHIFLGPTFSTNCIGLHLGLGF